MRKLTALALATACTAACAKRVPEPPATARGTPHISWVIMSGDSDNPDQDFVCQSDPLNDCVVPVSRPDAQVFSDVHVYYHGAGAATKYTGSFLIGFFRGSPASNRFRTDIEVRKTESITNQSVSGIVTSTPGTYVVDFALSGTSGVGISRPIQDQIKVLVR